jgi:hypothetical protein
MKESEGEEWLQNNYLDIYGADRNIETLKKKWQEVRDAQIWGLVEWFKW